MTQINRTPPISKGRTDWNTFNPKFQTADQKIAPLQEPASTTIVITDAFVAISGILFEYEQSLKPGIFTRYTRKKAHVQEAKKALEGGDNNAIFNSLRNVLSTNIKEEHGYFGFLESFGLTNALKLCLQTVLADIIARIKRAEDTGKSTDDGELSKKQLVAIYKNLRQEAKEASNSTEKQCIADLQKFIDDTYPNRPGIEAEVDSKLQPPAETTQPALRKV